MQSVPSRSLLPPEEEPAELARFRAEWLAELRKRNSGDTIIPSLESEINLKVESSTIPEIPPISSSSPESEGPGPSITLPYVSSAAVRGGSAPLPPALGTALNIYRRAVNHEQRSELDDALLLYRQAFRMDPHVDRAYHRGEMLASVIAAQKHGEDLEVTRTLEEKLEYGLILRPTDTSTTVGVVTGILANLVKNFFGTLSFEPEIEGEPVYLGKLPDELLVVVLRNLDPTSVERFATINRKARVLALDSAIWRHMVATTYKPPQVPDVESMVSVVKKYFADYRRIFIEQPRVRMDGVYIAICHYIRPGLSENSWVNISHLITYHRYLRFFPNGQVLSLLTNEEYPPQQIIPLLKPSLRMKGLLVGTWLLSGTTLHLSNLLDASGRFPLSITDIPSAPLEAPSITDYSERTRYAFMMTLDLRSRPLGRWNKMNLQSYNSMNLETGDISPVALKHERPFWFSKVRSYAVN
ncbi:hypothetical protein BDZ94DRAFT_1158574 [Collybia nuda]|uniref:F-box domain-containing protein n=1 Tax=Collybia nuda TaxID=64659 RepID=A0A9P6CMW2_9AGAR|nr:hypothetical protein BDZ94DRAFT_1158574 [Collybia nuda]